MSPTAGVCGVDECHASCLLDVLASSSSEDISENDLGACDGHRVLISGACTDVCGDGEDAKLSFQQVRCGLGLGRAWQG